MLAVILLLLVAAVRRGARSRCRAPPVAGRSPRSPGWPASGWCWRWFPAAAHRDADLPVLPAGRCGQRRLPAGHRLPVRRGGGLLGRLPGAEPTQPRPGLARYSRRFYAGLNLFAWSMLAAPMMNSLALLWIAVEVTTVVSALLVAIENTDGAAEAAWKYVLIASAGLGLALLATIFAYYAGAQVLGQHYDLAFTPLLHAAEPGCRTLRCGWRSCWPYSATAPRWGCSRCTPGCPTRTRRHRRRSPRCCPGRCSRSASTRSCATTRSPRQRWAPASRATCCWSSALPRCCWPRCTCWTSGT